VLWVRLTKQEAIQMAQTLFSLAQDADDTAAGRTN